MRNLGILLILVLSYYGCQNRYKDDRLEDKIRKTAPNTPIILNNITSFDWDTMRIAGPYTVSEELNIKPIPRSLQKELDLLSTSDNACIIIFTNSGKVIKYAKIDRSIFDFSKCKKVFTRGDSIESEDFY